MLTGRRIEQILFPYVARGYARITGDWGGSRERGRHRGPNGERRTADAVGTAVMAARIAAGEIEDTGEPEYAEPDEGRLPRWRSRTMTKMAFKVRIVVEEDEGAGFYGTCPDLGCIHVFGEYHIGMGDGDCVMS